MIGNLESLGEVFEIPTSVSEPSLVRPSNLYICFVPMQPNSPINLCSNNSKLSFEQAMASPEGAG